MSTNNGKFQSTPHLSGKANARTRYFVVIYRRFQSTPHLSGKANVVIDTERGSASSFNPRLNSAARRTHVWIKVRLETAGFNPRLTSAARRTGTGCAPPALVNGSNHPPTQ